MLSTPIAGPIASTAKLQRQEPKNSATWGTSHTVRVVMANPTPIWNAILIGQLANHRGELHRSPPTEFRRE